MCIAPLRRNRLRQAVPGLARGHSQISITTDVYIHVVHDTQREAISHMDRLLKSRPPTA